MATRKPLISIITATYNRGHILYFTISALLQSEFRDWECIIVGDACTDDTQTVVRSFHDPRLRFINLERNFGEQSGPNNHGCTLAKGKYIAFLNHDDLWFPDHLSACISGLEKTSADLVFSIGAAIDHQEKVHIECISDGEDFSPHIFVPASTWLFRREMLEDIGPWRSSRQTHDTPSQEWLWRAWRKKKKLMLVPKLTAVLIQSGFRKNCYSQTNDGTHRKIFQSISRDPRYRESLMAGALVSAAGENRSIGVGLAFRKLIKAVIKKILLLSGISPRKAGNYVRYRLHGGYINYLRKKRGLGPK